MPRKEQLIGELVGLARATDGNEHLIHDGSAELIRRVMLIPGNNIADTVFKQLNSEIIEQKRSMVPDCFHCAAPCGRTAAFDLDSINALPDSQKNFKHRILSDLAKLACRSDIREPLYQGLILLGMDDCPAELPEFWDKMIDEIYR